MWKNQWSTPMLFFFPGCIAIIRVQKLTEGKKIAGLISGYLMKENLVMICVSP